MPYRLLTEGIPGLGGTLKAAPEDFEVEEVPLYEPAGEGEHAYVRVEKRGLSTLDALSLLARAVGARERDVGYAGLKDAGAVARQTLSFRGVDPSRFQGLALDGVRVLSVSRHRNKLRAGHLRGNRFRVRVRDVTPGREGFLGEILEVLERRGVPNYFGPQRFGIRGNGHRVGAALLRRDFAEALRELVGAPSAAEGNSAARRARELFEEGREAEALSLFPASHATERRLLSANLRGGRDPSRALRALPARLSRLFLCAFQSHLFNRCLERRLERLDALLPGDVAVKHANGAAFRVENAEREEARAARFEVSPSGPLLGPKMLWPEGEPGEVEREVLGREAGDIEVAAEALGRAGLPGGRRALRYRLGELAREIRGRDLFLSFFVPRGGYATAALAEVMKGEGPPPGEADEETGHEDLSHGRDGLRGERPGAAARGGGP